MIRTVIVGSSQLIMDEHISAGCPGALTHAGTSEMGLDHVGNMADTDICCFLSLTDWAVKL